LISSNIRPLTQLKWQVADLHIALEEIFGLGDGNILDLHRQDDPVDIDRPCRDKEHKAQDNNDPNRFFFAIKIIITRLLLISMFDLF